MVAASFDVARLRLASQRLVGQGLRSVHEVVSHLGAVQAQDYAAAKWSVGMRLRGATDELVECAINEGRVVRTHVMRPTWHLVAPEDLRWMQALTAPRVHAANTSSLRKLDLDAAVLARARDVVTDALRDGAHLTRAELSMALRRRRIDVTGQRLAYVMMHAELAALVCNGPRRGKQFTYALVDERVPPTAPLDRDESLARLATRYFAGHGPAQQQDLAWWSGLTMRDAATALALAAEQLEQRHVGERVLWHAPGLRAPRTKPPAAHVMSIFDELTIAYRDRRDLADARQLEHLLAMGNAFTSVVVIDGRVVGTWKRATKRGAVSLTTDVFRPLSPAEAQALDAAVDRYTRFLGSAPRSA